MQVPPYIGKPGAFKSGEIGIRESFAYFRGSFTGNAGSALVYSGGVRQWLAAHREVLTEKFGFKIYGTHLENQQDYYEEMKRATFCLAPAGWVSWSPRIFQAIAVSCIPVIIGPPSHLPFQSLLNYSKFTLRINPSNLDDLPTILASIPEETIVEFQLYLKAVWPLFTYAHRSSDYDAFAMAMEALRDKVNKKSDTAFTMRDRIHLEQMESCVHLPIDIHSSSLATTRVSLSEQSVEQVARLHAIKYNMVEHEDVIA